MIAATICLVVLLAGGGVTLLAILQPGRDMSQTIGLISGVVNVLLGLLAGYIAGRGHRPTETNEQPGNRTDLKP
jgi:uncharacterized membrane protein HdeD (DUF308 family)